MAGPGRTADDTAGDAAEGLTPEDAKIVALARAARVRGGVAEGAAVRGLDGRTYVGTTVSLPSLSLPALSVAVATAASSGAIGLEAAALVTEGVGPADAVPEAAGPLGIEVVRDLAGPDVPVFVVDHSGAVTATVRT